MKLLLRQNSIILLATFVIIASFGVQLGMGTLITKTASPCPFMGEAMAVCPMTVVDHIGYWKGLFAALPTIELLALVAAVIIVSFGLKILADSAAMRLAYWYHYYKKKKAISKLYNYLSLLFSSGILHPRIYV